MPTVNPYAVVGEAATAAARAPRTIALFAESSSSMFYLIAALSGLEVAPYCRFSSHYGSMGHALAGAVGFCAATDQRAIVVTGDGSLDLLNPLHTAVKHGLRLTLVVLNDSRLTLPYLGSGRLGALHAQATTELPRWDYTQQGSSEIGGRRVSEAAELPGALSAALSWNGCYVIDALIDTSVSPPAGARHASVDALFGPFADQCQPAPTS